MIRGRQPDRLHQDVTAARVRIRADLPAAVSWSSAVQTEHEHGPSCVTFRPRTATVGGTMSNDERPRCSVFIAVSVDGYIARTDRSLDWLDAVQQESEDYGYKSFFDSIDALVVGRKTYDTALGFDAWPYLGKRCIVLTRRPGEARHGEEFFAGDPKALIERLAGDGVHRVYVDGGDVIRQFFAAHLVDDLTLSVIPVLLGNGVRLFGGGEPECRLVLEDARSFTSGLAQLRYRVE
jgi:dihydrofolate reductase